MLEYSGGGYVVFLGAEAYYYIGTQFVREFIFNQSQTASWAPVGGGFGKLHVPQEPNSYPRTV